jgi:hypothetical protein
MGRRQDVAHYFFSSALPDSFRSISGDAVVDML